jgi:hypothetical protein
MWSPRIEKLHKGNVLKVAIDRESSPISYWEALQNWQGNEAFRSFFTPLLAEAPFPSFRWETPPVTSHSIDRPFEFVLIDSPELASTADPSAFAKQFERTDVNECVIAFPNLGGDAILVVPRLLGPPTAYGHLAAFVREAPAHQIHGLWQRVGQEMQNRIGSKPVWLNTAGAGVPWLHVRFDDRPKYYAFEPFRLAPDR